MLALVGVVAMCKDTKHGKHLYGACSSLKARDISLTAARTAIETAYGNAKALCLWFKKAPI